MHFYFIAFSFNEKYNQCVESYKNKDGDDSDQSLT